MVTISSDGVNLYAEVDGDGEPVVLLHGFPDSVRMWDKVKPDLLTSGYKVIAFDQRGFGESDAPPEVAAYKVAKIVEDARSVVTQLCPNTKVRLVGHDWGALIGWILSIEYPELVHSFVAISVGHPKAYKNAGLAQKLRAWYVLAFQLRGVAEFLLRANNFGELRRLSHDPQEVERWIRDLSRDGRLTATLNWYRANLLTLLASEFANCKIPAMGIYSTHDPALVEAQMTDSKRYVERDWRYERINCGHWIPTERPQLLAALLLDWFKL